MNVKHYGKPCAQCFSFHGHQQSEGNRFGHYIIITGHPARRLSSSAGKRNGGRTTATTFTLSSLEAAREEHETADRWTRSHLAGYNDDVKLDVRGTVCDDRQRRSRCQCCVVLLNREWGDPFPGLSQQ